MPMIRSRPEISVSEGVGLAMGPMPVANSKCHMVGAHLHLSRGTCCGTNGRMHNE